MYACSANRLEVNVGGVIGIEAKQSLAAFRPLASGSPLTVPVPYLLDENIIDSYGASEDGSETIQ